jgi:hypothetical protein
VAIGQGVLVALGCNSDTYIANSKHLSARDDYAALGRGRQTAQDVSRHSMAVYCLNLVVIRSTASLTSPPALSM